MEEIGRVGNSFWKRFSRCLGDFCRDFGKFFFQRNLEEFWILEISLFGIVWPKIENCHFDRFSIRFWKSLGELGILDCFWHRFRNVSFWKSSGKKREISHSEMSVFEEFGKNKNRHDFGRDLARNHYLEDFRQFGQKSLIWKTSVMILEAFFDTILEEIGRVGNSFWKRFGRDFDEIWPQITIWKTSVMILEVFLRHDFGRDWESDGRNRF